MVHDLIIKTQASRPGGGGKIRNSKSEIRIQNDRIALSQKNNPPTSRRIGEKTGIVVSSVSIRVHPWFSPPPQTLRISDFEFRISGRLPGRQP
jgi:predicted amidohydrolase